MAGKLFRSLLRAMAYLWASPNTLLGLVIGGVIWCAGGRVRLIDGAIECYGGWIGRFLDRLPNFKFTAITFGHAILGTSHSSLCEVRTHEHVHVRQYERWGIFFLPAYWLSSIWQVICGRDLYRDNYFEKQAYAASPELIEKMFGAK